jgi:hypothetical protein
MAQHINDTQTRYVTQGRLVSRATATLPATAAQNIFTIAGGRVIVIALVGEVTTIIQAQSTTVKITSTPTTGSAVDLSNTTADINALEVGGRIALPALAAAATTLTKLNAGYMTLQTSHVLVPIGNISYTTGATSTGSIKWDLIYVPFDTGANVTAA